MRLSGIKKGFLTLFLSLITALSLVSCASHDSTRSPAEEKRERTTKDGASFPSEFHGRRFERNNQY